MVRVPSLVVFGAVAVVACASPPARLLGMGVAQAQEVEAQDAAAPAKRMRVAARGRGRRTEQSAVTPRECSKRSPWRSSGIGTSS